MSEGNRPWSEEQVIPLLQKVDLFEGLPDDDLRRIAGIVEGTTLPEGDTLFEEGEPGDAYYIVFSGSVEILKSSGSGMEKLAVRRAGDGFGEMALLNDAPRSATVRAAEQAQLMVVPRETFQELLGGDSLALRMMRVLSKALRALGIRFANQTVSAPAAAPAEVPVAAVSRALQRGMMPTAAPRADGYDLAAGTTTEETGRGNTVWDRLTLADGREALVALEVKNDGLPAAHLLGQARAALRVAAATSDSGDQILAKANAALADMQAAGSDQFVDCGVLIAGPGGISWSCAGKIPGGILGRAGTFEPFASHGPALGMLEGFKYGEKTHEVGVGDSALVLAGAAMGLFRGAADLVAQVHGKPAGEVVSTVHRAVRKAQGENAAEISVLYVRKH